MNFFRKFFKSKFGLAITLAFLGLIAFAFASSDVANTGTFGGVAGGERVAVVGDAKIGTAELSRAATNALDRLRQQNPTLSMQAFVAQGGLDTVIDQLIDRYAIISYSQEHGLRIGNNLLNSEMRQIPAFRGPDGNFSAETYRQAIAAQGLTDAMVREDIRAGLLVEQMLTPAGFGTVVPAKIAKRYAALFKERRIGAIGTLPATAFLPAGTPSAQQLQAFYTANRGEFIRPERRIIRYALFGSADIPGLIEPTQAETAARYKRDSEQYAASETRSFTQLIVPTQAAANALRDQVAGGASFAQVAQNAGLRTSQIGPVDKAELRSDSSAAVANAYFAASRGALAQPARSPLGWHIAQVTEVDPRPARPLASVRSEIADTIREEKRLRGLIDLAARIEEEIDSGATLTDIAQDVGLELQSTRPVTADGTVYGASNELVPEGLEPALQTAFQMDESEPQVAEVERGETYLVFETADITPSAAAPLAEIRDQVIARWRLSEGNKRARAAADRVLKRVEGGATLAAAMAAEEVALPAPDQVNQTREELARLQSQRVPAPLALFFSMAQGSTKKLEAPRNVGWFVVDLDKIEVGTLADDDPLVEQARAQLSPALGNEYVDQLMRAMRDSMGVERNEDAIEAVRKQLTGER